MSPVTGGFIAVLIITANVFVISGCGRKEQTQEEAAQIAAEKMPKLYSKANGCEVYRFAVLDSVGNINRYAYFAKCDNKSVRVEDSFQECHTETRGKIRKEVCETIDNSVGASLRK